MFKHIQVIPLIVGIIVGICGIWFMPPDKNIVYKYPIPNQADNLIYKDKNEVCYQYVASEVSCDKSESRLKDFPLSR
jgi:hypothetical protein